MIQIDNNLKYIQICGLRSTASRARMPEHKYVQDVVCRSHFSGVMNLHTCRGMAESWYKTLASRGIKENQKWHDSILNLLVYFNTASWQGLTASCLSLIAGCMWLHRAKKKIFYLDQKKFLTMYTIHPYSTVVIKGLLSIEEKNSFIQTRRMTPDKSRQCENHIIAFCHPLSPYPLSPAKVPGGENRSGRERLKS
jgi:hypothetical protein